MADEFLKKSLVAELDRSRAEVSRERTHLKEDLAFGRKLKHSVARHPAVWLGGAVLIGLVLSRLPRGRKPVKIKTRSGQEETAKAGLAAVVLLPTLKFLFSSMQPALTAWISKRAFGSTRPR